LMSRLLSFVKLPELRASVPSTDTVPLFKNDPPATVRPPPNGSVSVPEFVAEPLFTAIVPGHDKLPPLGFSVRDPPLTVNDVVLRIEPADSMERELPAGISKETGVIAVIRRVTGFATGTSTTKLVPTAIVAESAVVCPGYPPPQAVQFAGSLQFEFTGTATHAAACACPAHKITTTKIARLTPSDSLSTDPSFRDTGTTAGIHSTFLPKPSVPLSR